MIIMIILMSIVIMVIGQPLALVEIANILTSSSYLLLPVFILYMNIVKPNRKGILQYSDYHFERNAIISSLTS